MICKIIPTWPIYVRSSVLFIFWLVQNKTIEWQFNILRSPFRIWNLTDIGAITLYLQDNKIQHIIIIWTKRHQNVTEKCHKSRSIRYKVHSDHYIQRIFSALPCKCYFVYNNKGSAPCMFWWSGLIKSVLKV